MKFFLVTFLSLVLGVIPHHLAFASANEESSSCCGCNCGVQPTPRPLPMQSVPYASVEAREEAKDTVPPEKTPALEFAPRSEPSARRVDAPPDSAVPLFRRHCALLI
jgi:hypothetical protein